MILPELERFSRFIVGGHSINNLWYADDTVFITDLQKKLQELLNKESQKKGLAVNCKKTKCCQQK